MRKFTAQEDQYLRDNYLTIPAKRMAKNLKRSEGTARQRMKLLGIVVPRECIEKFIQDSRIKPGSTPPNKGKPWSEWMPKKGQMAASNTSFKKGSLPVNTKYDGAISKRRDKTGVEYLHIRIKQAKWELLHRVIWMQHNGIIPPKMIIAFKDGNQGNCNIDNLEMISMAENMKRNSYHRYPKEIALMVQLRGALNRQINKHLKNIRNEK